MEVSSYRSSDKRKSKRQGSPKLETFSHHWLEAPEWWEEDCDACKIIVFFFDEIKNTPGVYSDWQRAYDSSIKSIRHHSPEWLEKFNLFKNKILKAA